MKFILEIFIKITSEFECLYKEYKIEKEIHNFIIQIIYSLVIAVLLGLPLQIIMAMILSILDIGFESRNIYNFIIPIYIFVVFSFLINYNRKNSKIRLSESLLKICYLLKLIKWKKNFKETMLNLLIIPLVLSGIIIALLVPSGMSINKYIVICIIVLVINLIVTLILYGEFQYDEEERSIRQFLLWGIIFLLNVVLNIYQYSIYLNSATFDKNQMVSFFVGIFGLIFTLATIGDKTRVMYDKLAKANKKEVAKYMDSLENGWICEVINLVNKMIIYVKVNPRKDKIKIIKKLIIIFACFFLVMLIESLLSHKLAEYVLIMSIDKSIQKIIIVFLWLSSLIAIIYVSVNTAKNYRDLSMEKKIIKFSGFSLIISINLFLSSYFFQDYNRQVINVAIAFFLLFILGMFINEIYIWLYSKKIKLYSIKKSLKNEEQVVKSELLEESKNNKEKIYEDGQIIMIVNNIPIYYCKK